MDIFFCLIANILWQFSIIPGFNDMCEMMRADDYFKLPALSIL